MRFKQIFLVVIFLAMINPFAWAQRLNLMPRGTELVDQQKRATDVVSTVTYKYYSDSTKEEIIRFYRHMFAQDGFTEIQQPPDTPAGSAPGYGGGQVFFFMRQELARRSMIMINFLYHSEQGETTYFLTVYDINAAAITPGE